MNNLFVYSFYTFKIINNIGHVKTIFDNFLKEKYIKGTILVANEGINGTISGSKKDLDEFIDLLKYSIKLKTLAIKANKTNIHPFNRMKVRIKNEIVSLGQGSIDVCKYRGNLVNPETWSSLISDNNTKVIDVRNEFEISIGKFAGSINPETKSFRQFPNAIKKLNINKNDTIAMYCTGGIRCEKASAYLRALPAGMAAPGPAWGGAVPPESLRGSGLRGRRAPAFLSRAGSAVGPLLGVNLLHHGDHIDTEGEQLLRNLALHIRQDSLHEGLVVESLLLRVVRMDDPAVDCKRIVHLTSLQSA